MKKYIAPIAKFIDLQSEGSLMMTLSGQVYEEVTTCSIDASNERDRSVSGSIWGYEE